MTVIAAILFILLMQVFGGGFFGPPLWSGEQWIDSALITYLLLALIIIAGWLQARGLPAEGVALRPPPGAAMPGQVDDPRFWRLLTGNVSYGLIWLPVRFYVGREWLSSGVGKLGDPAWMDTGEALAGFFQSAVAIPEAPARPRIAYDWYRELLQFFLDREASTWFAPIIAWGETLIGLGLLFGGLVGIAAFFGTVLNFNFLLAGTASSNPVLFGLGVFLVLAWKVAGFWGLDRWLLPAVGTPWQAGQLFDHEPTSPPPPPPPVATSG